VQEDQCGLDPVSKFYVARKVAGVPQAEVAERLGLFQTTVARLEAGGLKPTPDRVREYSQALLEAIAHKEVNLKTARGLVEELLEEVAQ